MSDGITSRTIKAMGQAKQPIAGALASGILDSECMVLSTTILNSSNLEPATPVADIQYLVVYPLHI